MSLARYADPFEVIKTSLELGRRGQRMTTAPDGDTMDRIAALLRQGGQHGIHPQWTLRKNFGVSFDLDQLAEIVEQVEEDFTSGESPDE